ncbi:MAG: SDR family oxidoreductase [Bacteroidales bacterium]|nr:SDR family oxidoreductase [Bacteroidales bacterium]
MKKVILITGASSGFGLVTANFLSEKGYIVYGTSRNPKESFNNNVRMLKMDVTDRTSVDAAISILLSEQDRIDVVINNAGMGICGALELATPEEIKIQMDTNFIGTVNVCNSVIPTMRAVGKGKIINISSIGGVLGIPFQGFYSASKFAIEGYSETLSLELRPFGIKVCLVEPGDFSTGFTDHRKISFLTSQSEFYGKTFNRTLKIIEKEERNGGNPIQLAKALYRIIEKKHPRFRYKVGGFLQIAFAGAKAIIPDRIYQFMLCIYYSL